MESRDHTDMSVVLMEIAYNCMAFGFALEVKNTQPVALLERRVAKIRKLVELLPLTK